MIAALLLASGQADAAGVDPAGYTNTFDVQPSAEDWASTSRAGASTDIYNVD